MIRARRFACDQEILEMDPRLKKTIAGVSLFAFGMHTVDLAHEGVIGHELPSAIQWATVGVAATGSTASYAMYATSFGNAITEAVYHNIGDSRVLKHDGETLPAPSPATKPSV
jgi:hypothetical protein